MSKRKVAIIGSGNIGTDLMIKILRHGQHLEMAVMVGIDPQSDGLARARRMGVAITHEGVEGLTRMDVFKDIDFVFDATSAGAHVKNDAFLRSVKPGIRLIDLTPAAIGPYCVPVVNLEQNLNQLNVNMVTCGGQATIPMVAAVSRVAKVHYAEIVASIASKSAGPGTRFGQHKHRVAHHQRRLSRVHHDDRLALGRAADHFDGFRRGFGEFVNIGAGARPGRFAGNRRDQLAQHAQGLPRMEADATRHLLINHLSRPGASEKTSRPALGQASCCASGPWPACPSPQLQNAGCCY